jgi:hypothetical protein
MFTIDLLTGKPLLLTTTISGGTSSSGSTYQQVNTYADLPAPSTVSGQIYVVRSSTGIFLPNNPISNEEMEDYLGKLNGKESLVKARILKQNGIKRNRKS